jgi:cell division cycle 2-like protein
MACRGHPSLVEIRAAGRDASNAFLVMEYVGPSLAQVMQERSGGFARPFAEADARRLMRQLLDGLKICDFGLSRFAAPTTGAPYTPPLLPPLPHRLHGTH